MQSRAMREGSVGLMLVAGLGIFGAIALWLRGLTPGSQNYNIIAQFAQAPGIQPGGSVRFRGIRVGKIAKITPGMNGVDVTLQIDDPTLKMPKDVAIEVSQTGLIGEPVIEITPRNLTAVSQITSSKPLDNNCDRNIILCNNTKVDGQIGASFNELLRRATKLVELYNDPVIIKNINKTLTRSETAAADISRLANNLNKISGEFSTLPKTVESELKNISSKAGDLSTSLDRTTVKIGQTADKFNQTADRLSVTAQEYKKLAVSVNTIAIENRKTFATSLDNFNKLSVDLRATVNQLNPAIVKLNSTMGKLNSEKFVKDLEGALANANQTAANLKSLSANLNDPKTIVLLQQTLDSARSTFQNTQKITADLDDLTGNPEFRSNLRNLVNGLGKLVSYGEQLEEQAKLAQTLEPMKKSLDYLSKLPPKSTKVPSPATETNLPQLSPTDLDRFQSSPFLTPPAKESVTPLIK
jgi:phospholipid/cholesterol/gamma-HCH transport system substrate-binding protein